MCTCYSMCLCMCVYACVYLCNTFNYARVIVYVLDVRCICKCVFV